MKYILVLNDSKALVTSLLDDNYVIGVSDVENNLVNDNYWHIDARLQDEKSLAKVVYLINDQHIKIDEIINNYEFIYQSDFEYLKEQLTKCILASRYLADCLHIKKISYTDYFVKEMSDLLDGKM